MKRGFLEIIFSVISFFTIAIAASAEPFVLPLWPEGAPDKAIIHAKKELIVNRDSDQNALGLNRSISFISVPEMTVHLAPADKNSGAAVVIFPGGGYSRVVIDKEGHDVARMLNDIGVNAVVVKYRTKPASAGGSRDLSASVEKAILADAQQAMRLVRRKAKEWNIHPGKIGVMGFSAGGHLAAMTATRFENAAADQESVRPNFAVLMYPVVPRNIESRIQSNTPPMFVVVANDDKTTPADYCLDLCSALREHAIPVEMHVYVNGGHGFGLGVRGGAVASWPGRLQDWLIEMKFVGQ